MKFYLIGLLIFTIFNYSLAQNIPKNPNQTDSQGRRQGKWTILFNFSGEVVDKPEEYGNYLIINYLNDKPIGKVQRFNLKNQLIQEFSLLADRPELIIDGPSIEFDEQGAKKEMYLFKGGTPIKRYKYFFDGSIEDSSYVWLSTMEEAVSQDMDANYPMAFQLFLQAKAQADQAQAPRDKMYGYLLNNLGFAYHRQGEYAKAIEMLLEAKKILKVHGSKDEYKTVCESLGSFYEYQGKYDLALQNMYEAKTYWDINYSIESPPIQFYQDFARLYFKIDQLKKRDSLINLVEKYYDNQLKTTEEISADFGQSLIGAYYEIGLISKILIFRQKVVDKIVVKFGKNSIEYAQVIDYLAFDYQQQGDYQQALTFYLESARVKEKIPDLDSTALGVSYANLGLACRKVNQIKSAVEYAEKARLIFEKRCSDEYWRTANPADLFAEPCRSLATINYNLGFAYLFLPNFEKAFFFLQKSAAMRKQLNGDKSLAYAISCEGLAYYHQWQNRLDSALHYLKIAETIYASESGKNSLNYAETHNYIGDIYYAKKDFARAYSIFRQDSKVFLSDIQQNFANLSEKEQKLYYQQFNAFFEKYVAFMADNYTNLPETLGWIYDNTLITKGLLFQSSEKVRRSILNSKDQTLIEKYRNWKQKKDFLAKVVQMSDTEKQKKGINEKDLNNQVNQIEKELAQKSQTFASILDKGQVKWQDVQKQLKINELAIEIIRFRTFNLDFTQTVKYIALIISPTTKQPELVILENGNELETKYLRNYRNAIQAKRADKFSYPQFWAKIQEKLPSSSGQAGFRLYISVDGAYNMLNINTLQNPETKQYVGEMYEIQMVSNTRDLITYSKNAKTIQQNFKNYQIHLFGYPEYSGEVLKPETDNEKKRSIFQKVGGGFDTTQRFLSGEGKISVLEGTKVEVENISQLFKNQAVIPKVYLSKSASEDALKKLQSPDILHIATHGYFLADLPDAEEGQRSFGGIETRVLGENPLLRCGLLLANAEQGIKIGEVEGQENGVLTAQEAMNLSLDNTDLVVMSACETGLGEIKNGEGVYGLQRAFQQAGAKTVLMSLWTVSDEATQELMTLFYQNLITKKQPKRLAFQNAQNELKKKFPEPYYWGAFVMVGE